MILKTRLYSQISCSRLCIVALILISTGLRSQDTSSFVTTWNTILTDSDDTLSITIPIDSAYVYNYDVDWEGDGIYDQTGLTSATRHEYEQPGEYEVRIKGVFPKMQFLYSQDKTKIISIDQWGNNKWKDLSASFFGTVNMEIKATDAPDLSEVKDVSGMFRGAHSVNTDLSHWDVSNVEDMSFMFHSAISFNSDISTWDVSNVTNLRSCFSSANRFNQDITSWDVSKVTDMSFLFYQAYDFDQDIGSWDVAQVTNMQFMFLFARAFNQDINDWNVARVESMETMFYGADQFNQNLNDWDVGNVKNMRNMFSTTQSFNGNISNWDVSKVENMQSMFSSNKVFSQDLSDWNTESATQMGSMFNGARSFNCNLARWNVSNVRSMAAMLNNSALSVANFDSTLIGWSQLSDLKSRLRMGCDSISYCTSESARNLLINNYDWRFSSDIKDCSVISSIKGESGLSDIEVFPNPSAGEVKIKMNNSTPAPIIISVYNYNGKLVERVIYDVHKKDLIAELYLRREGLYSLSIFQDNKTYNLPLLIH